MALVVGVRRLWAVVVVGCAADQWAVVDNVLVHRFECSLHKSNKFI